jgi:protein-tyrosine-phosphatase
MRRRQWARAQFARTVRGSAGRPRVLFVCQGNICRSPFAAALLRARLGENDAISVYSAGMMPQPGRATPVFGLQAAAEFGIDLAAHRSEWLTREAAAAAILLVVFDEINRAAVFDRYPDLTMPVVRLDELGQPGEIADPVDGRLEDFRRCYQLIAAGVTELAGLLI